MQYIQRNRRWYFITVNLWYLSCCWLWECGFVYVIIDYICVIVATEMQDRRERLVQHVYFKL